MNIQSALKSFIFFSLFIFSCNKKDDKINEPSNFTWTYLNQSYTASNAAAYISPFDLSLGPNHIVAYLSSFGAGYKVSIRLSALNPNIYQVSASNTIGYIDDFGSSLGAVTGTVTIITNAGNKLSGNFDVRILKSIGDTTTMKGQFNNVVITP